jgi:hypothetical protein
MTGLFMRSGPESTYLFSFGLEELERSKSKRLKLEFLSYFPLGGICSTGGLAGGFGAVKDFFIVTPFLFDLAV